MSNHLMKRYVHLAAYIFIISLFSSVIAQDSTCSVFVQDALAAVEDNCASIGRNQACYGNDALVAVPRTAIADFNFEAQGDLANVADIESMHLRQLDLEENIWGIALMKIQANLPDALPGQNVTFLLFGDVEIRNAVEVDLPTIEVTSTGNINVRSGTSTNYPALGSLETGETVIANGRIEDGSWLRIQLPETDSLGWVFAELVTSQDEISTLSVVTPEDSEIPLNPMQAFYFTTGLTGMNCTEAPQSGILIQTPEGAGEITLRANDVDIQLGSSAYFQAEAGSAMTVSVIEGQGSATAFGETVAIPAGSQVVIPIDETLSAAGAPSEAQPYDITELEHLPVQLLPQEVDIAPPLTEQDMSRDSGAAAGGFDPSAFAGMDIGLFCQIITQAFAAEGMTVQDYLAEIQSLLPLIPAESRQDFDEFVGMLQQCE